MRAWPSSRPFTAQRRPLWLGCGVSALAVALATAAIYPLKSVAPTVSLGVVYLPAVALVSVYWGLPLGLGTSVLSAAAFNFFHIPPVGRFTIADSRNWVALAAFVLVAGIVSTIAEIARNRTFEAESRQAEADLAAALARELLAGERTESALGASAHRIAQALGLSSAAIELKVTDSSARSRALPLRAPDGRRLATLIVPRTLPGDTLTRLRRRVVPALEALVAIALDRDAMQAEAVETAALRRSDELKTALLRAVSHDLRTPLTAIVTAGHALGASTLTAEEREQLSAAVVEEGGRLSTLIDKLLDLSRLQAGRAIPHLDLVSIDDVLAAARDAVPEASGRVRVRADPALPPVQADGAQLERVFANLLENALRYSAGEPVSVQAQQVGTRLVISVVDRGPGIGPAERERIFEPFYRGGAAVDASAGAGLGLAIAKGFVEANNGTISVESLPGQGTSFTVSLPVPEPTVVSA